MADSLPHEHGLMYGKTGPGKENRDKKFQRVVNMQVLKGHDT